MFNHNYDAKIRRLVLDAWNDDAESFAELYSLTVDDIYNYCMHILDDKKESLQAVNEVYKVVKDNILKLKDPSLFSAWVRRIAFDVCYRKAVTSSRTDLFTLLHPDELLSLPFFERQIFFLHDFTGLSDKEIANALHIRKKLVLKILTNAREHMLELREFARS